MFLDRTVSPLIQPPSIIEGIQPEVIVTSSGARLHIYKNNVQPVVRVEFVFKAGKWYQSKAAVASMTAKMLKEGTISYNAKEIADYIELYGASLDVSHGFDRSTVTLYCLTKFLPYLLPLVFELIQTPTFPVDELQLIKKRTIQGLAIDKQKNSYLATEQFTSVIYGKDHPYATTVSDEAIESVSREDILAFHAKAYSFSDAEVFVTGDLNAEDQAKLTDQLNKQTVQLNQISPSYLANIIDESDLIHEDSSNQMQAAIRIGKEIKNLSEREYASLYLLNHTLGGYFGSRLMANIREDKGYTYGVYSSISHKEHSILFSIGTDIKGDKIEETLTEIEKELNLISSILLSEEELNTVKKHLLGKFLNDQSTIFDKMDRYKSNILLGLPTDFITRLSNSISTLTAEDLQLTAVNHLTPTSLVHIAVGGHLK